MKYRPLALLATGLLALTQAQAAAVLYDDFGATTGLDRSKWSEAEAGRYIDGKGKLNLLRYLYSSTASDAGLTLESFNNSLPLTTPLKSLKATVAVQTFKQDEPCAANPAVGQSTARLIGSHFNIRAGGPVAGDRTGDVVAQVRVRRASNSADPAGVLQVQAVLSQCTNADCSTSALITPANGGSNPVLLTTVTTGTALKLGYSWDKTTKTFNYVAGANAASITYAESHKSAPVQLFGNLSLRNEVPNCTAQRTKAGIAATFDNVYLDTY